MVWLSVCLLWRIDFEEKSFSFFFFFFLIGAFLWAVLKAIEENRARGRRLEEVEAVVCATTAAPAWGVFVFGLHSYDFYLHHVARWMMMTMTLNFDICPGQAFQ